MQYHLEEIINENDVDFVIQAHLHNYERTTPIYKNETVLDETDDSCTHNNPQAPIYIVTGNAGNKKGRNDPASKTPQKWSRDVRDDYGYGRLKAYNNTHIYWEQYSSQNKKVLDYVWVIKDAPTSSDYKKL